jgi:hypothetical protein
MSTKSRSCRVRQIYKFIGLQKEKYSVEVMCKVLAVRA